MKEVLVLQCCVSFCVLLQVCPSIVQDFDIEFLSRLVNSLSLLTGACLPTNFAITGKVRAFMKVIDSGTIAHVFLLLDHAQRPGNPCRWRQGEGARRAPCASDQGHSTVTRGLIGRTWSMMLRWRFATKWDLWLCVPCGEALEVAFGKGCAGVEEGYDVD